MTDSFQPSPGERPEAPAHSSPAPAAAGRAQPLLPGLPTGTGLGKYRVLERTRTYHHAIVYKARDAMLDRLVTLKQMAPDLIDDPIACGNFKREAQFLARCSFDPRFIVNIFELIEDEVGLFIVEEFVEGHWLEQLVSKRRVGPRDAPRLLRTAGAGLKLLHAQSITHRDIHPGNLAVTPGGVAKIANLSCAAHESDTGRPPVVTPRYAAPELLLEGEYDDRVDIYALGMTLYEVCVGRRAFESFVAGVAGEGPAAVGRWIDWVADAALALPPAAVLNPNVTDALSAVLERMTAKRLDDRFATIDETLEALAAAPSVGQSATRRVAPRSTASPPPPGAAAPGLPTSPKDPEALTLSPQQPAPAADVPPPVQPFIPWTVRPAAAAPARPFVPHATSAAPRRPAATRAQPVRPAARANAAAPYAAGSAPPPAWASGPSPVAAARAAAHAHKPRHRARPPIPPARTLPRIERVPTAPVAHESFKKKYPRIIRGLFVAALLAGVAAFGGQQLWKQYVQAPVKSQAQVIYSLAEDAYRDARLDESRARFRELASLRVSKPGDENLQQSAAGWLELLDAHKALARSDYEAVDRHLDAARNEGVESFRINDLQMQMWSKKDNERLVTEGMEALARDDFADAERAFMLYEERVGKDISDAARLRDTLEQAKRDYRFRRAINDAKRALGRDDFAVALGSLSQAEALQINFETRELRKQVLDAKNRFEWILIGDEALMKRDFNQAVSAYERAGEMAPSPEIETKLRTARAHLFLEQAKQAIASGDLLTSEDKLRSSLYNEETDDARRQLDRYAPAFEAARIVKRGDLAMSLSNFDEAEQLYRSALPQLPEAAKPDVQEKILKARRAGAIGRGDKAFFRGDLIEALREYREAQRIRNGPDVEDKIGRVQAQIP